LNLLAQENVYAFNQKNLIRQAFAVRRRRKRNPSIKETEVNCGKRRAGGFTLIELLVVVAILALVASLIIMKTEGLQKNATRSVDASNQEAVRRALAAYYASYDQWPDGWDTGLSGEVTTLNTTAATKDTSKAGTALTGAEAYNMVYRGDPNFTTSNQGVYGQIHGRTSAATHTSDPNAGAGIYNQWRKCTVFYLNNAEAFNRAPCKQVYNSYNNYTNTDGTVGAKYPNDHTSGSPYFALATGSPVLIIDRSTYIGCQMYKDLGQDPTISYNVDETGKEKAFTLVLLSLGIHNKMIGSKLGGLEKCPESHGTGETYINHYWVIFKIYTNKGADQDAQIVGVLDGRGDTVQRQIRLNKGTDPIAN
jgi:prepilin-type N-terminal cleavage/methylation domain-containing protein